MAHPLDETDAREIRRNLKNSWWHRDRPTRLSALLVTLGFYGLRRIEARTLIRRNLSLRTGTLYVPTAKGGPPRRIPINTNYAAALSDYHQTHIAPHVTAHIPTSPLLAAHRAEGKPPRQLSQRYADDLAARWLPHNGNYSWHSMRHTAAVEMYNATEDVLTVMRYLGHRSLSQTHVYLKSILSDFRSGVPTFER